ncbi:MAG: hypothetical protein R2827_05775 [Bdellovibrionales bacterium]
MQKYKKDRLFEKLDFLRQENIIEEEFKVLKEIELFYSSDPRLPSLIDQFQSKVGSPYNHKKTGGCFNDEMERLEAPSPGDKKLASLWLAACSEIVDKNPASSYNFAIMFYFMGCYEEATNYGAKNSS